MMNPMNPMNMFFSPNDRICDCQGFTAHKVPRMPIMIDQNKASPMDVREFTGRPLHTLLDTDALNSKMLQIFTSKETAEAFARSLPTRKQSSPSKTQEQTGTMQQALTAGVPPDGGYIDLYEDVDFGGCSWRLLEYNSHTVGNYGSLLACGFLWWGWKNADNTASSLDVRVSADLVTFFDLININFAGSTLWVPGDAWVPSLVPHGWNDRISSHLLWYFA
jgi:hypothetical protein